MRKRKTNWKARYQNLSKRRSSATTTKRKTGKRRSSRRRGPSKLGFTMAGIKAAFSPLGILLALVAAFGSRGAYGLLVDNAPELDDYIRSALAAVAPGGVAMAVSGAPNIVIPAALGGVLIALVDVLGDKVADAAGDSVPEAVKDALSLGVGYEARDAESVPIPTEPLSSLSTLTEPTTGMAGLGAVDFYETPARINVF